MRVLFEQRSRTTLGACGGLFLLALATGQPRALAQDSFVFDGQAGFVVSHIEYALSRDVEETGACPDGMTQGYRNPADVFVDLPDRERREGETPEEQSQRLLAAAMADPDIKNLCQNPELGAPDPRYRTVTGSDVPVDGIDLDGRNTTLDGKPAPGTCAHEDFVGMAGEKGIDNQFFRVVGCEASYQSTGSGNTFAIEMLTGSWGILITLSGVDDIRNDGHVEVGFYANGDPIRLSPSREPLAYATYGVYRDTRYHATTTGRIVDGVLTTEPVDIHFHWVVNSMITDRSLRDARVQMTISDEGVLDGYLAGYTPVEAMYDMSYGFRNARDAAGALAPQRLRTGSSIGKSRVTGYTCEGVYFALHEHADGHPDPETGRCTSISTQYRITAIPAFVVGL